MPRKLTTQEFVKRANKVHHGFYDYSRVNYKSIFENVCVIDPEYGEFWQTPNNHMRGAGCPQRAKNIRSTTKEFIGRARTIHGNLYDYSKVNYVNNETKVCIIDPEYGEFWQTPVGHLFGYGNRDRVGTKRLTTEKFIEKARKVHGELYDYSKVQYQTAKFKVCIIDSIFGEFWQYPNEHLRGKGCSDRSYNGKLSIHKDHIIPISILGSRAQGKVDRDRPLYKFLNGPINIQEISGNDNLAKSDWVEVNGKQIRARHVKNDYRIIAYLAENLLNKNIDDIIELDKFYL